jgi:nitroreductase
MSIKYANTDHPVHELVAQRWSPYSFDAQEVEPASLRSLFEAARWAASSYNAQPWSYIVATRGEREEFERMLSCLVEANQSWAGDAAALALGITRLDFERNGKPNQAAHHDLGAASAGLSVEATARGLSVHQMIGILPERARELYSVPAEFEILTALAIGYATEPERAPESLAERDQSPRARKPLAEFVFSGHWQRAASFEPNS